MKRLCLVNSVVLRVALISHEVYRLAHSCQRLDKLVEDKLLEPNACFLHILEPRQIRLVIIYELITQQFVHLLDLFAVLLRRQLGLVLVQNSLLAHRLHRLNVEFATLESQHCLMNLEVGLFSSLFGHVVDLFRLFYFALFLGEGKILVVTPLNLLGALCAELVKVVDKGIVRVGKHLVRPFLNFFGQTVKTPHEPADTVFKGRRVPTGNCLVFNRFNPAVLVKELRAFLEAARKLDQDLRVALAEHLEAVETLTA